MDQGRQVRRVQFRWLATVLACLVPLSGLAAAAEGPELLPPARSSAGPVLAAANAAAKTSVVSPPGARVPLLEKYCAECHNFIDLSGGMSIEDLRDSDLTTGTRTDLWEKILRRVGRGEMPPAGSPAPSDAQRAEFAGWVEGSLDRYAAAHPNPGRGALRRMNRAEYANAVRDLLSFDVDVSNQLPADDAGYGFDNIGDVLSVSPTLMDRYIAVAGRISRTAAGLASQKPFVTVHQVPKDASLKNLGIPSFNERASDALPLDSRGGSAFQYYAPYSATYEIRAYLNANTNTELDRLPENLVRVRVPLKAGLHTVGMSFRKQLHLSEAIHNQRNTTANIIVPADPPVPMQLDVAIDGARAHSFTVASYVDSPRFSQANYLRDVLQMEVEGPFNIASAGDTPSRRKIYLCRPSGPLKEAACVQRIVSDLARRAYRRPVGEADTAPLLRVYQSARAGSDFEHGIEAVVQAILVSPKFLFMREQDPDGIPQGAMHRLSDIELATRLSFFLWSSIPDEELLAAAEKDELSNPALLKKQVTRMLADPRAEALTRNFAGQWLYLRNLDYQQPDVVAFPGFDTRLRQAMKQESELFFASILRENRSVLDFINADYTYLNQRLAEHYGIAGVRGTAFRRVSLGSDSHRGGLLGQGAILTVTSYGNRTSVVKRGKWILESLLSAAPPPPPPDIPALQEVKNGKALTAREQLELHRSNQSCAMCHKRMDPLGFALENYNAIGAWRTAEADGTAIDSSAVLANGTKFGGPQGLRDVLLARKDQFTEAFTDRLLTYALGRGLEPYDQPTVRAISRQAAQDGYRVQSIILGIVTSVPFTMRRTAES